MIDKNFLNTTTIAMTLTLIFLHQHPSHIARYLHDFSTFLIDASTSGDLDDGAKIGTEGRSAWVFDEPNLLSLLIPLLGSYLVSQIENAIL